MQAANLKLVKDIFLLFHQIDSYTSSNEISLATMVHVSSASVQLLQLTVGQANPQNVKYELYKQLP